MARSARRARSPIVLLRSARRDRRRVAARYPGPLCWVVASAVRPMPPTSPRKKTNAYTRRDAVICIPPGGRIITPSALLDSNDVIMGMVMFLFQVTPAEGAPFDHEIDGEVLYIGRSTHCDITIADRFSVTTPRPAVQIGQWLADRGSRIAQRHIHQRSTGRSNRRPSRPGTSSPSRRA